MSNTNRYEQALEKFLTLLTEKRKEYNKRNGFTCYSVLRFEVYRGRKYDKIVEVQGITEGSTHTKSYCWVDRASGALMKGNWKRVEDKRQRGNIYGDNPLDGTGPYGLYYMVGPDIEWGF